MKRVTSAGSSCYRPLHCFDKDYDIILELLEEVKRTYVNGVFKSTLVRSFVIVFIRRKDGKGIVAFAKIVCFECKLILACGIKCFNMPNFLIISYAKGEIDVFWNFCLVDAKLHSIPRIIFYFLRFCLERNSNVRNRNNAVLKGDCFENVFVLQGHFWSEISCFLLSERKCFFVLFTGF